MVAVPGCQQRGILRGGGRAANMAGNRESFAMTRAILLTAVLLICAAASPEQQVRDAEKAINDAYAANDLPTYFSYYAPDLRALYPEGPTNLPDYIKSWTATIKSGAKMVGFADHGMVVQVSPSGDAAVASYQATAKQLNADKSVTTENFNETDVWFKRKGAWKIVEIHYSEIPEKK
jgi:ketosteroid isomerase-like protein